MSKKKSKSPKSPDTERGPATHDLGAASSDHRIERLRLQISAGPASVGTTFESSSDRIVIGTHPSCQVVLADEAVSRFHCDLTVVDGAVVITDLGSTNGTLVDGVGVLRALPRSGSVIRAGSTELRLEVGAPQIALPTSTRDRFGLMIGGSLAMRRAFALLEKAADSEATILLLGETGTGKDIAAESIHLEGVRRDGPFVVVDCGAIPADLLESELFGHEKGAFTGATARRQGAFFAATGGTILLDEIGELPLDLQPKLLRVLEKHEVKRVGADAFVPVDVRVIAATNRDLRAEVNARRFRSDLYYRLAVVEVHLPALRERIDDVPALVDRILERLDVSPERAAPLRTPAVRAALMQHSWSGNVRELRNYVERSLALREPLPPGTGIGEPALPVVNTSRPFHEARQAWLDYFERRYAEELLARCGGNLAQAARESHIDRVTLYRLLWRHRLR